jgi:thiol-disulfide isomerase/thioredoxin
MKKNLLFLLLLLVTKIAAAQQYTIKANITGFNNGAKFYLKDVEVDSDIDSAIIQNNQFVLKGRLADAPKSLWLYTKTTTNFYYVTLMIGNETVQINGDIKDFPFDLSVSGSKTQDEHNLLINQTKDAYKQRNKLLQEYFSLKKDSAEIKGKKIWRVIGKLDSTNEVVNKRFIKDHLNSYEGLYTLFFLKNKYPNDTLRQMYNALLPEFKQSSFGQRIGNYIKVGPILNIGDAYADFEAIDKTGLKHKLSEIKGKYILLDFSTTYCGPCIESLEDLKIISKKYAGQLEIISFSGDGGKANWLKGLARDKPTWLCLWDGKGNYGETIAKYGVTGYPSFFLIDPQGKIVSKWTGYGKKPGEKGSLETKVDDLLVKK